MSPDFCYNPPRPQLTIEIVSTEGRWHIGARTKETYVQFKNWFLSL